MKGALGRPLGPLSATPEGGSRGKRKSRVSLTCDLAPRIMPTRCVHLQNLIQRELFLSPQTSFFPLLLSLKSCCSERLLLPATDNGASPGQPAPPGLESLQLKLERGGGLHRVCSQTALDEETPPSGSQLRRRASSKLPGLSGPHPSLPPPSPADSAGRRPSDWARCGDAGNEAASVLCAR